MCGPKEFGSFEFKGETITINTEEKYLYWNEKLDKKVYMLLSLKMDLMSY